MNKENIKFIVKTKDDYMVFSNIYDKINLCYNKNILTSTDFLSPRKRAILLELLKRENIFNYEFCASDDNDERKICIFKPNYEMEYDVIRVLRVIKNKKDELSHRDYLGALMGLDISRGLIGDIFINEFGADIIIKKEILNFLLLEFKKVGNKNVDVKQININEILRGTDNFKTLRKTVSSLRLDAVVSALYNVSRNTACDLISSGRVILKDGECLKNTKIVNKNETINIRGHGKVFIDKAEDISKKGKIIIEGRRM